jgi:hypothetical protein
METLPSSESWLSYATHAVWGMVALSGLFYFVYCYLIEILAQKHDEPRWMAWVPIVNGWLMLRLVGWERWFWWLLGGYVVALGSMFLPGTLMLVGAVVMIPTAIALLVIGFAYFPKLAVRRGLPLSVGLWVILPQFVPPIVEKGLPGLGVWVSLAATLVALGAFLKIVFHDGRPPSGPHPIGYALTLFGAVTTGAILHVMLPKLVDPQELQAAWQQLAVRLESTAGSVPVIGTPTGEDARVETEATTSQPAAPDPVEVAATCPPETREAGGWQGEARAWWCELDGQRHPLRHGPSRSWFDNGYLETEGVYDQGLRTGTWTRYWRSGGRRFQAEFRDDGQHGWMHRWDVDGNLVTAVRYAAGEPVPQ